MIRDLFNSRNVKIGWVEDNGQDRHYYSVYYNKVGMWKGNSNQYVRVKPRPGDPYAIFFSDYGESDVYYWADVFEREHHIYG